MCLSVIKSHVRKPIAEMECVKRLEYRGKQAGRQLWVTPYRGNLVPIDAGWFAPLTPSPRRVREYRYGENIEGGYLHAYTHPRWISDAILTSLPTGRLYVGESVYFYAIARDVVALGDYQDLVCRALYIPAFDITGAHRNAQIKYT